MANSLAPKPAQHAHMCDYHIIMHGRQAGTTCQPHSYMQTTCGSPAGCQLTCCSLYCLNLKMHQH